MARGQAGAADRQRALTNQVAGSQLGQANALEAGLIPKYESMMNEGYRPEELNAMRTAGLGSEAAAFDTAGWQAGNRAARTGNAAGVGAEESQLARDKGVAMGDEAAKIEMANANARLANRRFALEGESGLFGENQRGMESLYGMSPALLQARAAGPGWTQGFKDVFGTLTGGAQTGSNIANA